MIIGRLYQPAFITAIKFSLISLSRNTSSFFPLKCREIISIRGSASIDFIQGLTTNDVRCLSPIPSNQFSLFLNTKGRVVCDAHIYHINLNDSHGSRIMIECDKKCKPSLLRLLHFYNIHKKVDIAEEPSIRVFACLDPSPEELNNLGALFIGKDPRSVPAWSWRMLIQSDTAPRMDESTALIEEASYKRLRYCLGIPEGAVEFKVNEGLPLEANADICHGVSFNKGCYVGQELTARSRFVGVIRKRIAPIIFETPVDPSSIPTESPIYRISKANNTVIGNRPIGWIRGIGDLGIAKSLNESQVGLALIRLAECAEAISKGDQFRVDISGATTPGSVVDPSKSLIVYPYAPFWWPEDIAVGIPRMMNPLKESS